MLIVFHSFFYTWTTSTAITSTSTTTLAMTTTTIMIMTIGHIFFTATSTPLMILVVEVFDVALETNSTAFYRYA